MTWIIANIKWIMIVSVLLTSTMIYAAVAPESALQSTFGESLSGPLAQVVVRNWGALIAMVGVMLLYGAFNPPVRPLVLVMAGVGKAFFIFLVLSQGGRYLGQQAAMVIVIDSLMVVLFAWFLLMSRRHNGALV